jgi:transglutaminase/protease-like cytokinesis protein 3
VRLPYLIFLLFPFASIAQSGFYGIDSKVAEIPFSDAKTLSQNLASLGKTDKEKVRAIFRWITEHIDYNIRPLGRTRGTPPKYYDAGDDTATTLAPLDERIAAKVLYKGVAFCDGYSRLFKTLCKFAGIKAEVIFGYARANTSRRFGVNHAWNAVYIDSSWYLLDVTWASGVINFSNQYVRQYDDSYFLTPPEAFIRDHYPEDPQWTLVSDPPVYREFARSPFRYSGSIKLGLNDYSPSKGVIEGIVGDTITIEFNTRAEVRNFYVSESPVFDSVSMTEYPFTISNQRFSFKYNITSATGEWLYVFCNDELMLKYKLNIRRDVGLNNH